MCAAGSSAEEVTRQNNSAASTSDRTRSARFCKRLPGGCIDAFICNYVYACGHLGVELSDEPSVDPNRQG